MEMPVVRLRAIEPEDLDVLYRIENDTTLWDVGATNVPYSRYTLHDYIASSSDDIYADRQVRMMIENEDSTVVGMVDLVAFSPEHRRAEVSVVIMNGYLRRGYAMAALSRLHDYALRILHLHQLYAVVAADNIASVRLFVKAGYEDTTHLRNWLFDGKEYHDAVVLQCLL